MNRAGFTTLAMDLRGHGESRQAEDGSDDGARVLDRDPKLFNAMYLDVAAAVDWLREHRHISGNRLALVGASVGCSVAMHAVASGAVIPAAVVLMTPGTNYLGVPTMQHIKSWPDRSLLILSSIEEQDRDAVQIHRALKNRGAELVVLKQDGIHGTRMFGRVEGIENRIALWLLNVMQAGK
ncbi:hypothetical protein GF1_15660 [Desulfolithobacter dissulfuricans]|uniref:Serine aminopeptidase S33 domain-containing protein n=1 Tax=Desulfolithobacter dissulfuricans TaxID=2795293 RepID=A0A915XII1_9BACT|nr:hypothetical protein GF1_15660 [Desulfolithobacter dissulfuricans]